jgi:hypothetical protein
MQAHDSDSDSEGGVGGAGQPPANNIAAVQEQNEVKTAALRDIDERGSSEFHRKVWLVAGTGFFTDE